MMQEEEDNTQYLEDIQNVLEWWTGESPTVI